MFAQTSANHTPITPFITLSKTESTNNYAMAKLHAGMVDGPCCFLALEQTSGRGQRGKQWLSRPGHNITMSTVYPQQSGISANVNAFPFLFSASIAMGCYDFIKGFDIPDVSVKWPNDVYIGDRKAAGVLIDNIYKGSEWLWSVAGTGINLNQVQFGENAGKPVSLKMVTGRNFDVIQGGRQLLASLLRRINRLSALPADTVMEEYNSVLYRKGEMVKLKKHTQLFDVRIELVNHFGELVTSGPFEQLFQVGEVEFM